MKKIRMLLLLLLSFLVNAEEVNAEEVNVDKLYIQAQKTLKNWYYFQKNESIDASPIFFMAKPVTIKI